MVDATINGTQLAEIPDLKRYARISREMGVTTRCPFGTVYCCPRFYQSLSLLGEAGSTKIPANEDAKLLTRWTASDLWPRTGESATSISGPTGDPHLFTNFCPEVAFDRFGYFASSLARYADEIDIGVAHTRLSKEHALGNDWRWSWASLASQHFTECPLYSILSHRATTGNHSSLQVSLPWWKKHFVELIVGVAVTVIGGLLLRFLLG